MTPKPPRQLCQICERRRLLSNFTPWGKEESICRDCEKDLMEMVDEELEEEFSNKEPLETSSQDTIPYDEIDANMVALVKALNRYPGVTTIGSCGGHEVITNPSQWEAGTWYVKFNLPANRRGWYLLEHLSWAINHDCRRAGRQAMLLPTSVPPYLNTPGKCLCFVLEGFGGENPDELASFLDKVRQYLVRL